MRVLKGTFLGLWLLGFGTMALFYFPFHGLPSNSSVDIRVISAITIYNPLWWAALIVCFVLGYAIVRSWPGPPVLWGLLVVTGLVPTVLFAMLITMVVILKLASKGHS